MDTPLLQTKLYIPPLRPNLVPRPRLIESLNAGLNHKLTVISAPAGFGKTTLVTEWNRQIQPGTEVAWLSLDGSDNEVARFLTYLVAALQTIDSDLGDAVVSLLGSPRPPPLENLITLLVNDLTTLSGRAILVLDDYHVISNLDIHQALTFLLDNLPPQLHLVLVSREDPVLPVHRLRGQGQVTEIHARELRFSEDEAAHFLNQTMGLNLIPEHIAVLERRTEGWVAGLQLAAISMQGIADRKDFIEAFAGDDRYVADYLIAEVIERQPPSIQDFLLKTAVLDRFTASLCDAVIGGEKGRDILHHLEQANLFIISLDNKREWYRYHHLFGQLLRYRLREEVGAEGIKQLHQRAAAWCIQNDLIEEALHHALAAEDFDTAAHLIESVSSPMIGRGEMKTVQNWIESLPEEIVQERPRLGIALAWIFHMNEQGEAVEPLLQDAERALAGGRFDQTTEAEVRGHIYVLRAYRALNQNDPPRALQLLAEAMTYLPEDELYLRSLVAFSQGVIYKLGGAWEQAAQAFQRTQSYGQASGNLAVTMGACTHLAGMLITQGRLRQAAKLCRDTIENHLADQQGSPIPNLGFVYIKLGEVLYEWNELEAANDNLEMGLALNEELMVAWPWTRDGVIGLARLKLAQGEPEEAQVLLEQANDINDQLQELFDKIDMTVWQVRLWLAQNNLTAAVRWKREYQTNTESGDEMADIVLARVLLVQENADQALAVLGPISEAAAANGRINTQIETLALQALAYQAKHDHLQARTALAQALSLAEAEGYIRTFVDEGPQMKALLSTIRRQPSVGDRAYIDRLLVAFAAEEKRPQSSFSPLVEPLTDREMAVLRLIAAGLSNREIADELYLSVNTIKWYTSHIYGKLGVSKRAEAVARAHELGIL